jgi:hypothetical protein
MKKEIQMSNPTQLPQWEEVHEDGKRFYVHPTLGNICEIEPGKYVVLLPKIVKLGFFETLEGAKDTASSCQEKLNLTLELFNSEITKK